MSVTMPGPFKEKYTPPQREALRWAMLDRTPRMNQAQATRAARNGTLREGLPAFEIHYNTVRDIRAKEVERRRRERANGTPVAEYASDVRALLARQLEEEQAKGLKADDRKLTRLLQGIKQAQELEKDKVASSGQENRPSASRLAAMLRESATPAAVGGGQSSANTRTPAVPRVAA